MRNEGDGPDNGNNTPNEAPSVGKSEPKDAVPSKPATEADLEEVKEQMSSFERSTLRWTRFSFFVILATGLFIALQWHEMHTGGADTHDLAVAAKTQAEQAKAQTDKMAESLQKTDGLLKESTRQSLAASSLAISAQQSVDAVQRQMELEQRPWVAIDLGSDTPDKKFGAVVGGPLKLPFVLTNIGKTPAKQVRTAIVIDVVPVGQEPHLMAHIKGPWGEGIPAPPWAYREKRRKVDLQAVSGTITARIRAGGKTPGEVTRMERVNGKLAPKPLSVPEATELVAKKDYIVAHGVIRYSDGFGVKHWATFCADFFFDGTSANNTKCAEYANDDNNWRPYTAKPN